MNILITGANGFIGKNLYHYLNNKKKYRIIKFQKKEKYTDLKKKIEKSDLIIHLAGVNRSKSVYKFDKVNFGLTDKICEYICKLNKKIPIIFSSSIQASENSIYGKSKLKAENRLKKLNKINKNPIYIYRLTNIFGKWGRANYNSVVTTFCYNIANQIPIKIHEKNKIIKLSYIDDVISHFVKIIDSDNHLNKLNWPVIDNIYKISLGSLAKKIQNFYNNRNLQILDNVASGFERALYSTFISYIQPKDFFYEINEKKDPRGIFVEIFKNKKFGQFSFFTLKPGFTRGNHYHHTKTEKFLILKGNAQFSFKNILSNKEFKIKVSEKKLKIIDTVPGWAHSIKNIGKETVVAIIWANEIFNIDDPDTYMMKKI